MLAETLVSDVLRTARSGGADFAELYVERWKRRGMRVLNGEVKEAASGLEYGAGLRLFYGTEVVYAYTNDLSAESLLELTETLVKLKGRAGQVDAQGRGGLDFRKQAAQGLHAPEVPLLAKDRRYRLERLLEAEAAARVAPEIKQVQTQLLEWEQEVLVATSEGKWVEDRRVRTRYVVTAIAQGEGGMQTGSMGPGKSVGLELFELYPPSVVGRQAGEQAMTNLRAKPAPAGTMPVVIGNAFGGVIFHEALGHLLETTSVAKKASVLSDRLGEKVASSCVTYIDDGTTPHGWGSSEFDDEGLATERTVLIENGVLKGYMVDRWGALRTGLRPTGSGRRQDYTFAPTSRMRNTFIAPGDTPKEKLFEGIEFGLYAKDMGGGQVKPGSGEYNFGVKEAYIIRRGRIEEPVRGAMLVGKGPDSISKIAAVSSDLETAPGMCGSLSGSLPVEVGQPHLLISEIVVGGQA
ncbi:MULTISPECIES: TldD/PmbA family protein [unclassified Meiothermus]|uniref:TldD/PmbA family protein n=1 Tax=unclassified Meiothermus TaxID=370471 RepID=UPI000D7C0400|nr:MULTISPECIES: TldD/PmbA family protein [unclassified Meiothermus]PZA06615.1 TldD/PmbA family protein [Meiothermus sp. Pnk-1]RYM37719.1 TldD/PmbA family protein [Meiothermus sp. PNK-Is4]